MNFEIFLERPQPIPQHSVLKATKGSTTLMYLSQRLHQVQERFKSVKSDGFILDKQNKKKTSDLAKALKNKMKEEQKTLLQIVKLSKNLRTLMPKNAVNKTNPPQVKSSPNTLKKTVFKFTEEQIKSLPPKYQTTIKKLQGKIEKKKEKIKKMEKENDNDLLKKQTAERQKNLKILIYQNNQLRTFKHEKSEQALILKSKLKKFSIKRKGETINARVRKQKIVQVKQIKLEINKIKFNIAKMKQEEESQSNSSLQQRLVQMKMQLQIKAKENNNLEKELQNITLKNPEVVTTGNSTSDTDSGSETNLRKKNNKKKSFLASETENFSEFSFESTDGETLTTMSRSSTGSKISRYNSLKFDTRATDQSQEDSQDQEKEEKVDEEKKEEEKEEDKEEKEEKEKEEGKEEKEAKEEKKVEKVEEEKEKKDDDDQQKEGEEVIKNKEESKKEKTETEIEKEKVEKKDEKIQETEKTEKVFEISSTEILFTIPMAVEYFKEYLYQEMCQENILFFLAVKEYKNSFVVEKKMISMANNIYKKYIKTGAIFEVNIDYKCRDEISKKINQKNITKKIFDEAQSIVFIHLDHNQFGQFKSSQLYQDLLKKLETSNESKFDVVAKKATFIKSDRNIKVINTEFWFTGKSRNACKVIEELMENMISILNSWYSITSSQIEFDMISKSLSFNRFHVATTELQRVKLKLLNQQELLSFFINAYNLLMLHAGIVNGIPQDRSELRKFLVTSKYNIGRMEFSLNDIFYGILRRNRDAKNNTYFEKNDPRLELSLKIFEPRIHFSLFSYDSQSIVVQTIFHNNTDKLLDKITHFQISKNILVQKNKIFLPRHLKNYLKDFGESMKKIILWVHSYLPNYKKKKLMPNEQQISIKFLKERTVLPIFVLDTKSLLNKKYSDFN
ncbi:electron carrier/ protein disulfide oxidoreductase [Anaeramoeba flamelloides]|uniref:Electron carrier/ protein disulfide oxidoreductase n=1 Tax=Anaeramoeba flamelloides TaxID=1746091 RepID=A0ABQ8YTQ6_9EUKA|nr:electron carrier/ protein disulfide oxidoreductase [Anaeramoeba flamelloides]